MSASLVGSEMCIRDRFDPSESPDSGTGSAQAPLEAQAIGSSNAGSLNVARARKSFGLLGLRLEG
eukprot:3943152-Alexandrium_andersonii.AAC.1